MRSFTNRVLLGAVALFAVIAGMIFAYGPARAQTDLTYFVGAISKIDVVGLNGGTVISVPVSGAAQALAYPQFGDVTYDVTLSANCTFTLTSTNTVAGRRQRVFLQVRNPVGAFTTTFPAGLKWNNGAAAPTIITTAGTVYSYTLETTDAGTTILAK